MLNVGDTVHFRYIGGVELEAQVKQLRVAGSGNMIVYNWQLNRSYLIRESDVIGVVCAAPPPAPIMAAVMDAPAVGDTIKVWYKGVMFVGNMKVARVTSQWIEGSVGGMPFSISRDPSKHYHWEPLDDRVTEPTIPVAVEYGATCCRCGELFEHAEKKAGFVCYGCRLGR